MTGRFNLHDPFQAEPMRLSRTALAGIAGSGQLPISPCSPLAVEPGAKDPAEPARAEALRALTPGSPVRQALEILAQPEALLHVNVATLTDPPAETALFLRGEWAAMGRLDGDEFHVGAPIGAELLASHLVRQLRGEEPPEEHRAALLWPSQIQFGDAIWSLVGRALNESVTQAEAIGALEDLGFSAEESVRNLECLAEVQFLESAGGSHRLRPPLDYWMELLRCGQAVTLEYVLLPEGGPVERVVFIGPPGRRVMHEVLGESEIARELPGVEPPEPHLVALTWLPAEALNRTIREFVEARPQQGA